MEHFYHTSEAAKFGSGISINVLRQKNEKNWQIFFQYFQVKVLLTFLKLKRKIVQSSNWRWKTIGNKCSVSMKKKERTAKPLFEWKEKSMEVLSRRRWTDSIWKNTSETSLECSHRWKDTKFYYFINTTAYQLPLWSIMLCMYLHTKEILA